MDVDLAALPDDVETLQRMVRTLAAERSSLSAAKAEIERLVHRSALMVGQTASWSKAWHGKN